MLYTIKNDFFTAEVNDRGAELSSLTDASGRNRLWWGDPAVWGGHSPLLFPVVGRLVDDRYIHNGKTYSMNKHGFLGRESFRVTEKTDDSITLRFDDWQKHFDRYPFRYAVEVTHALTEKGVRCTHKVINLDGAPMYFSFGAHPGIVCEKGGYLHFEKKEAVRACCFDSEKIIDDETVPFLENSDIFPIGEHTFDNDAFILEGLRSEYIDVCSGDGESVVRVAFPGVPVVGVWAKSGAPYVCVEPWFGIDDDRHQTGVLAEKKQIVALDGEKSFSFSIAIEVVK